jgi:hypothetical protein
MKAMIKWLVPAIAIALPAAAFAQSSDAAYCQALAAKYDAYLNNSEHRGAQPQSVDARVGAERCKAGDPAGIQPLEKALNDAKLSLPSRS